MAQSSLSNLRISLPFSVSPLNQAFTDDEGLSLLIGVNKPVEICRIVDRKYYKVTRFVKRERERELRRLLSDYKRKLKIIRFAFCK